MSRARGGACVLDVVVRAIAVGVALLVASLGASSCLTPNFDGLGAAGASNWGGDGNLAHCHDRISNYDETGLDCGGEHCDGCPTGKSCRQDRDCESNSCGGGTCKKPTCEDLKTNQDETGPDCGGSTCDPRCDVGFGCVSNKDCLAPPAESGAGVRCEKQSCKLVCPPRSGDCNESAADGCEVSTESNTTHCGGCFNTCALAHVSASFCTAGTCQVDANEQNLGCDPGYADCDGLAENGCEAMLSSDVSHCGACNQRCSAENGEARCEMGHCQIDCEKGFENCNGDARSDGCEVDLTSSVRDCGGCGAESNEFVCVPEQPGWSPYCIDRKCGSINCEETAPGHGACDGDKICDDSLDTVKNCGACGQICVTTGGRPACIQKICRIGECDDNRDDCDDSYLTGCEANLLVDKTHCGGCSPEDARPGTGDDCTHLERDAELRVVTVACEAGACNIVSCQTGYADCDGDAENGCEVDVLSTDRHCGGCTPNDVKPGAGEDCETRFIGASGDCVDGMCRFDECDEGHVDCEGDDGCETDLDSVSDCGGCDVRCGGDQAHTATAPLCTERRCQVSCESDYCTDLTDPERPCSKRTGTDIQNCEVCGQTCGGSEPYCDPELGCRQLFPISVVGTPSVRTASNGSLTSAVVLASAANARGRALVVTIATPRTVGTVRFGGVNMILAAATAATSDTAYSYIYYLLSSALGAPGTKNLEIGISPGGWGGVVATPFELINVAQVAPAWSQASRAGNAPCAEAGGTYAVRQAAKVDFQSSWAVSVLSVRAGSTSGANTATAKGLESVLTGAQLSQQSQAFIGYTLSSQGGDLDIGWDVSGGDCWDLAMTSVVLSPVTQDGPSESN